MAKKKKQPTGDVRKLKPEDIRLLWKKVPVQQWYALLQRINPGGQWTLQGHTIKGCCPYHDDKTPSFFLHFDKCIGKCFGSCGKVVTDLVQLVARLQGTSYVAALTFLSTEIPIQEIIGPGSDELVEYNAEQEMKKAAAGAMREVIAEYVRDRPKHLEYLLPAIRYLVYGRKIPLDLIGALPLGLFAKPEHLKKYIPEDYHDIFDAYFSKVNGPRFWGSPCFHYNNAPGSISRFKLRTLRPEAEEESAKYKSGAEMPYEVARNLADKAFIVVEDKFVPEMGVYGLHHYNRMIGKEATDAYVTEGEFDALAVMVEQLKDNRNDFMIFAFGGNGNSGLSFLRELGIRTLWVVQDAPSKNGDGVVKRLLMNGKNFVGDNVNKALAYKIFCWAPEMLGGDLDEAVQHMGYQGVYKYLMDERMSYFVNTYTWVTRKCDAEVDALKADVENKTKLLDDSPEGINQRENLQNSLPGNIVATVRNWFSCLHEQVDKLSFVQKYTVSEGIDFEKLNEVNAAMYELNTMEGAVARLRDALREHLEIVYYENAKGGCVYTLWSKREHEAAIIPMNDSGTELVLSQYLGKDVLAWAKQILRGSSLLLPKPTGDELVDNQRIQKNVLFLLRRTMMDMVSNSQQMSKLQLVGQGIHYADMPQAKARGKVYFVNGTKVFVGTYNPASGAPIEWEFLNSVVDGSLLFQLHPRQKWSDIEDVSELYAASQVDLANQYRSICTILDGWKFEHHEIMREYLAAWIMSLPVQRAIGQVNITFLTGESTSGKTSFVRGLLGGYGSTGYTVPSIVECAKYSSDATAAWCYQEMDQSSLLLGLDEAESRQDTAHSLRVKDIQQILYSIPTGGAKMTRGGVSADQRADYFLQLPVIMAAINMSSEATFLTRVVVVYTQKDLQRRNIGDYITDIFDEQEIRKIRLDVTRGLLPHIPELSRRMTALRTSLARTKTVVKVSSRYIDLLLPALTVYDFLGYDAGKLFQDMVSINKNLLETLNSQEFQSDILNAVLYTKAVKANVDDHLSDYVSAHSLIRNGDYNLLNNAGCGVKVLPEKRWIIIIWRDVKHALLNPTAYRSMDEASLREAIAKNAYVINEVSAEDHKYIVEALGRSDIKNAAGYSIVELEYLLTKEEQDSLADAYFAGNGDSNTTAPPVEDVPVQVYEADASAARGFSF